MDKETNHCCLDAKAFQVFKFVTLKEEGLWTTVKEEVYKSRKLDWKDAEYWHKDKPIE